MKKFPGEGFKRAWPPLIKMDESVKQKVAQLVSSNNNIRPGTSQ
jgi:hypothetical protein